MGVIATVATLVLGLLTGSAKSATEGSRLHCWPVTARWATNRRGASRPEAREAEEGTTIFVARGARTPEISRGGHRRVGRRPRGLRGVLPSHGVRQRRRVRAHPAPRPHARESHPRAVTEVHDHARRPRPAITVRSSSRGGSPEQRLHCRAHFLLHRVPDDRQQALLSRHRALLFRRQITKGR